MTDNFIHFIDEMAKTSGQYALCEAIKKGYKVCCEAVSKDSFQIKNPMYRRKNGMRPFSIVRYEEGHRPYVTDDNSTIKRLRDYVDSYRNDDDYIVEDISPIEYRITEKSGEEGIPDRVITYKLEHPTEYYDPNIQFGRPREFDARNIDGEWETIYDNPNPIKPASYYNHTPEERSALRRHVWETSYGSRGGTYDEDILDKTELDPEHESERRMERAADEAMMNHMYGEGNWSY